MRKSKYRKEKIALIKAIEAKMTDAVAVEQAGFGDKYVRWTGEWKGSEIAKVCKLINEYLHHALRNQGTEVELTTTKVRGYDNPEFLLKGILGDISFGKRGDKQGGHHEDFIALGTLKRAWRVTRNEFDDDYNFGGMPTWHKLALFLNVFVDYGLKSFHDWVVHYQGHGKEISKLLNAAKPKGNATTPFDIDELNEIINHNPFWSARLLEIRNIFTSVYEFSENKHSPKTLCLSFWGGNGVTKTRFVYEVLSKLLFHLDIIKSVEIKRIYPNAFSKNKLNEEGVTKNEKINNIVKSTQGEILIIDSFNVRHYSIEPMADIIQRLTNPAESYYSCVILMGHRGLVSEIVTDLKLYGVFKNKMAIHFKPPSWNELIDLFEKYTIQEGMFYLTEDARPYVKVYFSKLKELANYKARLNYRKLQLFALWERRYQNASEFAPFYQALLPSLKYGKWIDDKTILNCDLYIGVIKELKELQDKWSDKLLAIESGLDITQKENPHRER